MGRIIKDVVCEVGIKFGIICLIFIIGLRVGSTKAFNTSAVWYAEQAAQEEAEIEAQKIAEEEYQASLYDPIAEEAEYVAKLLYGQARWNSEDAQRAVIWVVINRMNNSMFPNTIKEVVTQDKQWMGYSNDNIITQDLYDLAYETLTTYYNNGYHPFSTDYVYLNWSSDSITIRTTFKDTATTQYMTFR